MRAITASGIRFTVVRQEPKTKKGAISYLVQAPYKGPKFWVECFSEDIADIRAKVMRDFHTILGKDIQVRKGDGYYSDSGKRLIWNASVARFSPAD